METTGLKHLFYRCYKCGRGITCLEIKATWEKAQDTPSHLPLCPCGSRHISPSNPKLWEELLFPRIWKLWLLKVVLPWWKNR